MTRRVAAVAVLGVLAAGCQVGPAADRAEREADASTDGSPEEDLPGGNGSDDPARPGDPTEEPAPGPTPAPATGGATDTGTRIDGLGAACCVAALPDSEDMLVGSGDTISLLDADGDGSLTPLGQLPGELLGLAVPGRATGSYVSVYVFYAGPDGGQIASYPFFPNQDWAPWGESPTILLDEPVPLSGTGTRDGGALAFGPDGALYAGTGDAGDPAAAEDPESWNGKILRVDPNGSDPPVIHSTGPYTDIRGLAWDEDRMWAVDAGADGGARLFSVTPGGAPIEVEMTGAAEVTPAGLAASEGSLWLPAADSGELWRIPLNGSNGLVADPQSVLDLGEPRGILPTAGSSDLWALAGGSLRRLSVD
ncbi:PQQ-dependent sugar dehydrogenase [Streptomyces litchfieldiae]|uniref:PQQ-dependent sugar dehydrogenase n=1 Tax=Streptomyces litchfieldiae TaxID=3075543 RepID=A0ABU2MQN8_9ACTN|nr:PQQ-dependent sugar dehydrogenase [Streptomyces sp. DSM 44938]MDT0343409.1 PQQ-dependent sugar dehydrogenase [Streptomyces sp. DSM 44938]